jgi:hypothetical protein
MVSANKQAEATRDENTRNTITANNMNAIKLKQYEREQKLKEQQVYFQEHQEDIKKYDEMLNSSETLKANLTKIWGRR